MKRQTIRQTIAGIMLLAMVMAIAPASEAAVPAQSNEDVFQSTENQLGITLLNQDPDPVEPGDYVELRFKVQKRGDSEFENISFTLPETHPIKFDSSGEQTKNIGSWAGYTNSDTEYYILHYEVIVDEKALEKDYELPIIMNTKSHTLKKEFTLRVEEKKEPTFTLGQITTSPLKLYDDSEENKLDVALDNIGDENAKNVVATLELPEGFEETYGYSTRASIGTLDQGASKLATFYVDVDENMEPGTYEATLQIDYKEEGEDTSEETYKTAEVPLDINLHGRPRFEITDTEFTSEKIREGDQVSMYVTVKNTGTKEAESVSARVYKEASQPFDFSEKSDFIGHLAPGESGQGVLTFTVEQGANPKQYILDSEVRGIYNDEVIVDDQTVSIDVTAKKGGSDGLMAWKIPALIVLALLIIVGYLAYRTGAYEAGRKTSSKQSSKKRK